MEYPAELTLGETQPLSPEPKTTPPSTSPRTHLCFGVVVTTFINMIQRFSPAWRQHGLGIHNFAATLECGTANRFYISSLVEIQPREAVRGCWRLACCRHRCRRCGLWGPSSDADKNPN
jgi:hypothetical protein